MPVPLLRVRKTQKYILNFGGGGGGEGVGGERSGRARLGTSDRGTRATCT